MRESTVTLCYCKRYGAIPKGLMALAPLALGHFSLTLVTIQVPESPIKLEDKALILGKKLHLGWGSFY